MNLNNKEGTLVISLDFEMRWGLIESIKSFQEYKKNILGVNKAVDGILDIFNKHEIHATWAFVGSILCDDYTDFIDTANGNIPQYNSGVDSPFSISKDIYDIEKEQFFNKDLVNKIDKSLNQELASHTFSHLFLKEKGVSYNNFLLDNNSFNEICRRNKINNIKTIIFPRNQINFIEHFNKTNLKIYRGNQSDWYFNVAEKKHKRKLAKLFRFFDLHFSFKDRTVHIKSSNGIYNLKSSMFLRPYDLNILVKMRLKRIKQQMRIAKNNNRIFHLWWHPHNFGTNLNKNLEILNEIMTYSNKIGLKSKNIGEFVS